MLGVTAAYSHNGLGMLSAAAADHGPVLFVGHSRYGAGIDNIAVAGVGKSADTMAAGDEKLLHSLRFVLIYFAT